MLYEYGAAPKQSLLSHGKKFLWHPLETLTPPAVLMAAPRGTTAVFVYGTLKRGCFNHHILRRSLENPGPTQPVLYPSSSDAGGGVLETAWETVEPHPLLLKPERHVPALLPQPGAGQRVLGELYHCDVRIPPPQNPPASAP